jgi:hypothetical protein
VAPVTSKIFGPNKGVATDRGRHNGLAAFTAAQAALAAERGRSDSMQQWVMCAQNCASAYRRSAPDPS